MTQEEQEILRDVRRRLRDAEWEADRAAERQRAFIWKLTGFGVFVVLCSAFCFGVSYWTDCKNKSWMEFVSIFKDVGMTDVIQARLRYGDGKFLCNDGNNAYSISWIDPSQKQRTTHHFCLVDDVYYSSQTGEDIKTFVASLKKD